MRRGNPGSPVVVIERGGGSFPWLLAGAVLGAGIALLFAPAKGADTRRRLGKQLVRLGESADGVLDELRDAVDPDLSVARPRGADEGGVSEADAADGETRRRGGGSARAELERRLAAARARRQRALAAEDEEPVA